MTGENIGLEFRKVTDEIFEEFIELEVKPEQKDNFYFRKTKPNLWTLAQGYVNHPYSKVLAVYDDQTLIGSVFYSPNANPHAEKREAWVVRLMIDQRYQGKGYGRQTMEFLLRRIHDENQGQRVRVGLSYEPHNKVAEGLYSSMGFEPSGEMLGDQFVVWKILE